MTQTEVRMSELDDRVREFKLGADIDSPYDGQIIYFDLQADWEYEIIKAKGRLNAGALNATVKIQGADVPNLDPFFIEVGAVRTATPDGTGPALILKTNQLLLEIEVTTAMTAPEKFKFELHCRATKDLL
ncbi:MAG: hypothetical protein IIB57_06665 [Planctomycetes bacterium]|nr:hypothetical protein [Planctomycetota bacterium]